MDGGIIEYIPNHGRTTIPLEYSKID